MGHLFAFPFQFLHDVMLSFACPLSYRYLLFEARLVPVHEFSLKLAPTTLGDERSRDVRSQVLISKTIFADLLDQDLDLMALQNIEDP